MRDRPTERPHEAKEARSNRDGEVFERTIAFANDVALLSEEVVERTGELLRNFPQAFSHIELINAACAVSQAESSTVGA